jgi:hypothetical protein
MTVVRVLTAEKAARKIIEQIRDRLPEDSKWTLHEADGQDEAFVLVVFADIAEEWPVREQARHLMAELLERNLPIILTFAPPEDVADLDKDAPLYTLR